MTKKTKPKSPPKLSVDDQLAEHIDQAEHHLISAVRLFADQPKLQRRTGYLPRLLRAQELVTSLNGEELVRQRGPLRRGRR